MPTLTIRNVDAATVERLKARARAHRRSLEAELREVVERLPPPVDPGELRRRMDALAASIRARNDGRELSDTVELLREDDAR